MRYGSIRQWKNLNRAFNKTVDTVDDQKCIGVR